MTRNRRRGTWPEIVANHLKVRGHISEGTALIEYGRFRLGDAVYRLRTTHSHLLPEGMEIVTIHKQDTQGNPYGEYHLVPSASAVQRQQVLSARSEEAAAAALQN